MKAVLISIKPKWCDLIRQGRKTVEVRKTCPKLEVPFKVYIYETMDGGRGSGLVFGEFVCTGFDVFRPIGKGISIKRFPALYESCLTLDEIVKYAQGEPVYGWQISQLKLYEEPFKLENFSRHGFCGMNGTGVCGNADCENYQPSGNYMEPPTCAIDGCILYEAPHRLMQTLEVLQEALGDRFFLNQADTPERWEWGRELAQLLDRPCIVGALQKGMYGAC